MEKRLAALEVVDPVVGGTVDLEGLTFEELEKLEAVTMKIESARTAGKSERDAIAELPDEDLVLLASLKILETEFA